MFSASSQSGFRYFLRRQRLWRFANRSERDALSLALGDEDLQLAIMQGVHDQLGAFPEGILQLFQFLIDNADTIMALILQIISLFNRPGDDGVKASK